MVMVVMVAKVALAEWGDELEDESVSKYELHLSLDKYRYGAAFKLEELASAVWSTFSWLKLLRQWFSASETHPSERLDK